MSRIHPSMLKHELPFAGVLNAPQIRENRSLSYDSIRLHVSDLIKSEPSTAFCVREHALKHIYKPSVTVGVLSASFDLLFDLGNTLHDNARNRWMRYNKDGRKRVLARWSCFCGETKFTGVNPERETPCPTCKRLPIVFDEYEFVNKELGIVAHPDFVVITGKKVLERETFDKESDILRLLEIKGIDRVDLDWDTLDGPLGEHTLQGSMYYWIGRMAGYKISPKISYLYGDRAVKKSLFRGTPWKEFVVEVDPFERVNKVFNKAKAVNKAVKEKVVPARKLCSSIECVRAKGCALATLCFNLPGNEFSAEDKKTTKIRHSDSQRNRVVLGNEPVVHRGGPKPKRYRVRRNKR